jgi:hypothetical protein
MRAYLPDRPDFDPKDPLRVYLLGPGRPVFPPSPPWARLFLTSVEAPDPVRWRFCHAPCRGCGVSVTLPRDSSGMTAAGRAGDGSRQ